MPHNHQVKQDSAYVSNVSDADFAHWKSIPDMTRAKFQFMSKHLKAVRGGTVQISEDMRLAPKRYGFADSTAAAQYQADLDRAIVSDQ